MRVNYTANVFNPLKKYLNQVQDIFELKKDNEPKERFTHLDNLTSTQRAVLVEGMTLEDIKIIDSKIGSMNSAQLAELKAHVDSVVKKAGGITGFDIGQVETRNLDVLNIINSAIDIRV